MIVRSSEALGGVFLLAAELRRQMRNLIADEPWMADAGFRPPCIGVLQTVAKRGPISQREISERLAIDPSDVVSALDILERANMVERRRDPADRRRHAVVVTGHGERASRRLAVVLAKAEARALAGLDADERDQLADLVEKALRVLGKQTGL